MITFSGSTEFKLRVTPEDLAAAGYLHESNVETFKQIADAAIDERDEALRDLRDLYDGFEIGPEPESKEARREWRAAVRHGILKTLQNLRTENAGLPEPRQSSRCTTCWRTNTTGTPQCDTCQKANALGAKSVAPKEREIRVGSTWRGNESPFAVRTVTEVSGQYLTTVANGARVQWTEREFRSANTWLADPLPEQAEAPARCGHRYDFNGTAYYCVRERGHVTPHSDEPDEVEQAEAPGDWAKRAAAWTVSLGDEPLIHNGPPHDNSTFVAEGLKSLEATVASLTKPEAPAEGKGELYVPKVGDFEAMPSDKFHEIMRRTIGSSYPGILDAQADSDIIRAAEGVTLPPGEYEIIEIAPWENSGKHLAGARVTVHGKYEAAKSEHGYRWYLDGTLVTAVRRITPVVAPKDEARERAVSSLHAAMRGSPVSEPVAQQVRTMTPEHLPAEWDKLQSEVQRLTKESATRLEITNETLKRERAHLADITRLTKERDELKSAKWTAVATELPDSDVWVLAVNHEEDYVVAQLEFTDDSEGHGEPYWAAEGGDLALCNYPHWMPLPAPPVATEATPGGAVAPKEGA
jgi:hypothetical protein